MKQLALLFVIATAPFVASGQHKFHEKIRHAINSLTEHRPTLYAGIDVEYRVKKKTRTVKKCPARAGRRCEHKSRVRKQSKIRLYANIGFNTGKLVKQ
jgi:hypothetical protein